MLKENKRVYFEPVSHSYLLDGDELLIGVTSLMNKHGLSPDYSNVPKKVLENAAAEGTAIHNEIEAYYEGRTALNTPLTEEIAGLGLNFVSAEYLVSDNELTASSIDLVFKGQKKGEYDLVDIKTTQKMHRRSLEWQLGIYAYLFTLQNPGTTIGSCYCMHVDKKRRKLIGLVPIEPVSRDDVQDLLSCERDGLVYMDNREKDGVPVLTDAELSAYIDAQATIAEMRENIKSLEAAFKEYDSKVLDYMEGRGLDELDTRGGTFKVVKAHTRSTVDSSLLEKKFPNAYALCRKETQVKSRLTFKQKQS